MNIGKAFIKRNINNAGLPGFMLTSGSFILTDIQKYAIEKRGIYPPDFFYSFVGFRTPWFQIQVSKRYLMFSWKVNKTRKEGELLFLNSKAWEF